MLFQFKVESDEYHPFWTVTAGRPNQRHVIKMKHAPICMLAEE